MIDERTKESIKIYQELVSNKNANLATAVGRGTKDIGKGHLIWSEIKSKLKLRKNTRLLDIGCGYGEVTQCLLDSCQRLSINAVLLDIPEVIKKIKDRFILKNLDDGNSNVRTYGGIFPYSLPKQFQQEELFDFIIIYSVVHYTDTPEFFVEQAVKLLKPNGKLLIGDVANINKKGRFLATEQGRLFEAKYRKVSVDKVPHYNSHEEFVRKCAGHNKSISDNFVLNILKQYRAEGFDTFVLPQGDRLPYGRTREDLLIIKK